MPQVDHEAPEVHEAEEVLALVIPTDVHSSKLTFSVNADLKKLAKTKAQRLRGARRRRARHSCHAVVRVNGLQPSWWTFEFATVSVEFA